MLTQLHNEINTHKNPEKAKHSLRFFKTGKGEYGEGDKFLGLTVPQVRQLVKKYRQLPLFDLEKLLHSPIHEERQVALFILVDQYQKGDAKTKQQIYKFYLSHTIYINNWDLVDLTAPKIVGDYLLDRPRQILYKLAKSKSLWERRIAVLATFQFIAVKKQNADALTIGEMLLSDKHDLIHKAVGWMLREVGKRVSEDTLKSFLNKHYKHMPRTCLRYAIERLPEKTRKAYLEGII